MESTLKISKKDNKFQIYNIIVYTPQCISKIKDFFDVRAFALSSGKNIHGFVQAQAWYIFAGWHCSLLYIYSIREQSSLINFAARRTCEHVLLAYAHYTTIRKGCEEMPISDIICFDVKLFYFVIKLF